MKRGELNKPRLIPKSEVYAAIDFHRRRLMEMKLYDLALDVVVFSDGRRLDKSAVAYQRLLRQPISYQVLVLIWSSAGFLTDKSKRFNLRATASVYRLAVTMAAGPEDVGRLVNYVARVIEAAEAYFLVERLPPTETNRHEIRCLPKLHELLVNHAKRSVGMEDISGLHND